MPALRPVEGCHKSREIDEGFSTCELPPTPASHHSIFPRNALTSFQSDLPGGAPKWPGNLPQSSLPPSLLQSPHQARYPSVHPIPPHPIPRRCPPLHPEAVPSSAWHLKAEASSAWPTSASCNGWKKTTSPPLASRQQHGCPCRRPLCLRPHARRAARARHQRCLHRGLHAAIPLLRLELPPPPGPPRNSPGNHRRPQARPAAAQCPAH